MAQPLDLRKVAERAARESGFDIDFAPAALAEVEAMGDALPPGHTRDLTSLLWSSIDNPDSKDLDQIEVAEALGDGSVRVLVGIADVDSRVPQDSALDGHAAHNATSVYTGVRVFPMLPERLSTDLTSLNQDVERLAIVIEMVVRPDGEVTSDDVYAARVKNHQQLTYEEVGPWLQGEAPVPERVARAPGLEAQLRWQDAAAQALKRKRRERGAMELETVEARPVTHGGQVTELKVAPKLRSRELIEDFMIAANGAMARFLERHDFASISRVVRSPKRWDRIVLLAQSLGETLPVEPSSIALAEFLSRRRAADPAKFGDLSLQIVKMLGPGEYALQRPAASHIGHFGLAATDYTHSTAPNRRYPDLIIQRLVRAALWKAPSPYSDDELAAIAARCNDRQHEAQKVERFMRKVVAASLLASRLGEYFDAIVTGVGDKGTFVRLIDPPAEGRVVRGERGLDVGDTLRVQLVSAAAERGFIDFARA